MTACLEQTGVLPVEGVILAAVDVLTAKLRNLQQAQLPDEVRKRIRRVAAKSE